MGRVAAALSKLLKTSLHESLETVRRNRLLLPHVRALTSREEVRNLASSEPVMLGTLLRCAADFYVHEQRDRANAKHFLDLADTVLELPQDRAEMSDAVLELVVRLKGLRCVFHENLQNDLLQAERYLALAQEMCPREWLLQADLLHLAGNLEMRRGRLQEARNCMTAGLSMKQKHDKHFNQASLAYSKHGLGNVLAMLGERDLADLNYQDAIAGKVSCYGKEDHLDVARSQLRCVQNLLQEKISGDQRLAASQMMANIVRVFERDLDEDQYEMKNAKSLQCSKEMHGFVASPAPTPPRTSFLLLAPFIHPRPLGGPEERFYGKRSSIPPDILAFMKAFEPAAQFRKDFQAQFSASFKHQADQFAKDGLLILPSYFGASLQHWRSWYDQTMAQAGSLQPALHMRTFTATSHAGVKLSSSVQASVADPYLLALLKSVAGGSIQLSDFRAATTCPGEDVLFRAWKWHRDGGKEPE